MSDYGKQIFHGLCPYTGESCETFECGTCEVEADERLWLKEIDGDYDDESELDGDPIDIDKAVEHYDGTLETLKGIDLEVDG